MHFARQLKSTWSCKISNGDVYNITFMSCSTGVYRCLLFNGYNTYNISMCVIKYVGFQFLYLHIIRFMSLLSISRSSRVWCRDFKPGRMMRLAWRVSRTISDSITPPRTYRCKLCVIHFRFRMSLKYIWYCWILLAYTIICFFISTDQTVYVLYVYTNLNCVCWWSVILKVISTTHLKSKQDRMWVAVPSKDPQRD